MLMLKLNNREEKQEIDIDLNLWNDDRRRRKIWKSNIMPSDTIHGDPAHQNHQHSRYLLPA